MAHALLSPSGASRWLECTPSARLEAELPDKAGEAADEGTLAHKLGETILEYKLGRITKFVFKDKCKAIEKNKHYSEAMYEYCDQYATFIMEQYAEAQERSADAYIALEEVVDLREWIPDGFGTRDVGIVAAGILDITDLKFGKGVLVEAKNNKQMMLYGLGTLVAWEQLFDIDTVRMTIFQPRIDNYSTWEIDAEELKAWGETELKQKAQDAWAGTGEFKPGKHCQFCKIRATCIANADYQMTLAQFEFAPPTTLDDQQLSDIFQRAAMFKNWIGAVEKHMLELALKDEKEWPGLKLVQGRSNRAIKEKEKVVKLLAKKFDPDDYLTPRELLGIGALEKNIGKKELNAVIGDYVIKPDGKPALVPEDDKRPKYHSTAEANKDFADFEDD